MSNEQAIKAAKELSAFCKDQFCPDCIFNTGSCLLGEVGWTPSCWNQKNTLDALEEIQEKKDV